MVQSKKLILIAIIGLIVFISPIPFVLADQGDVGDGQTQDEPTQEEQTEEADNQDGDNGDSGDEEVLDETNLDETNNEDTSIETGDAYGFVEDENEVNTNITDLTEEEDNLEVLDAATSSPCSNDNNEQEQESATSTDELLPDTATSTEEILTNSATSTDEVVVDNDNEAVIENEVEIEVNTGDNSANNNGGDSTINTGDAVAVANLSNVANTNITGSNFWFLLSNFFYGLFGDVHLNNFGINQGNGCQLIECVDNLEVTNDNTGTIVNDVGIYALTGGNSASGNQGNASIHTGHTYVRANIFNLLNTNITGSNWFFGILNSFGDWHGNLVFPNEEEIEEFVGSPNSEELTEEDNNTEDELEGEIETEDGDENGTDVENDSQAYVENNVDVVADTGQNSANSNYQGSVIETGDAEADVNVSTIANTNIFGNNWLLIGLKVFGQWDGQIFSLPEGISWMRTPDGLILFSDALVNDQLGEGVTDLINVANNNIGTIINDVNIYASTGGNSASYNGGSGTISTGNASVAANIANFVNTNIIGKNWLFALVNVFGDWQGNLAFGQPDLWIGASAVTIPNDPEPSGLITYTLSYTNNGDAHATQVTLVDDFDDDFVTIVDAGGGATTTPGQIEWDIGPLAVGDSGSISYSAVIHSAIPYGQSYITNTSTIDSFEDDANDEDNTDTLSILIDGGRAPTLPIWWEQEEELPYIIVNKTNDTEGFVVPGDLVNYTIVLVNEGDGAAYDVVVTDTLTNTTTIQTLSWDLGEVYPNEEIIIEYSLAINGGIEPGFYTNTVEIEGTDTRGREIFIREGEPSSVIEVRVEEGGEGGSGSGGSGDGTGGASSEESAEVGGETEGGAGEEIGGVLPEQETETVPSPEEMIEGQIEEAFEEVGLFPSIPEVEAAEIPEESEAEGEITRLPVNGGNGSNLFQNLLAAIGGLLEWPSLIYLLILIIIAIVILVYLRLRKRGRK